MARKARCGVGKAVDRAAQENFIRGLVQACETHDDWLVFVFYGLGTLLDNQRFLVELIVTEAERLAASGEPEAKASDAAPGILEELGLRLVVA